MSKRKTNFGFGKFEEIPIGKNKIYFGPVEKLWIVEKFEFRDKCENMYSVIDGFHYLADAIDSALNNQ